MRRRVLLLAACATLPLVIGAYAQAQAEADRRLDAAIARARASLGPADALEFAGRTVDPVTGVARLTGVTLRQGGHTATAEEVTLRDVDATRVGEATFRALRVTDPVRPDAAKGASGPPTMTIARVSVTGLVLPAVPGGPRVDWSGAAVESAVAETVSMDLNDGARAAIARLSVSGYAPGSVREAVVEGMSYTEEPAKGTGSMRIGRARLAGAVLPRPGEATDPWAFAADAAALEGVELNLPEQRITFGLGRLAVNQWGESRMTSAQLADLRLGGPADAVGPFELRLASLAFEGLAARDMARAFADDRNPPQPTQGQEQSFLAEGLSMALNGVQVAGIGAVRARNQWDTAVATTQIGTVAIERLTIDLPREAGGAWLDSLGYKQLQGGFENTTRLVEAGGQLVADPFALRMEGMGTIGLTFDMRGWQTPEPGQPAMKPEEMFAMMSNWQLASMTVRYVEEGFLRRVVAQQATQARVPEARLREQYAQMVLTTPIPGGGKEGPPVTRLRQAVAAFVRNPGTLEFAVRPPRPVPLLDMAALGGAPGQTVERLNITATATPPR